MSEVWLQNTEAARYYGCTAASLRMKCKRGKIPCRTIPTRGGTGYEVKLTGDALVRYIEEHGDNAFPSDTQPENIDTRVDYLQSLPSWQRAHVAEWQDILAVTAAMKRAELKAFAKTYTPRARNVKVSAPTIYAKRKALAAHGIKGLCPGWGSPRTKVDDRVGYEVFKRAYLSQNKPGAEICRLLAYGHSTGVDADISLDAFPSAAAFLRRLRKEIARPHIDLAREGVEYYKRRHEFYVARDWSNVAAGQGWTSDHHQFDVMVALKDGRTARPWATVWRDLRSGKILSIYIHVDAPNADHVFQSFAWAVEKFGIPEFILIDNGKDYRCTDFTGLTRHRVWTGDTTRAAISLMGLYGIKVLFAEAYNAQAKPVERDFQKIIGMMCKLLPGYTGSNVTRRPEKLKKEIAVGALMSVEDFTALAENFVDNIYNVKRSRGDLLRGMCPDDAWRTYRGAVTRPSPRSISLCYMRTKTCTVQRNGIIDKSLGAELMYWNEALYGLRGKRVYIRRDVRKYETAWVFDAETDDLLCSAQLYTRVPGFATTDLEKEQLKERIRTKRADLRSAARAIKQKPLDAHEVMRDLKRAVNAESNAVPATSVEVADNVLATPFDAAVERVLKQENKPQKDFASIAPVNAEMAEEFDWLCLNKKAS